VNAEERVRVEVADLPHRGVVTVARSNVYACPEGVPLGAVNVPIEAFPPSPGAPFRVRVRGSRPTLACYLPTPAVGERVLLCLISRDLLSLFVARVAP
jgi:hypothetical protein